LSEQDERALKAVSDSELMVKQLNGVYKGEESGLKGALRRAQTMLAGWMVSGGALFGRRTRRGPAGE